jgi:2-keto-4-pentenoate hydratase
MDPTTGDRADRETWQAGGSEGIADMMDARAIQQAADALLEVRRGAPPITALPPGCEPTTFAEAYAIQDVVTQALSSAAGWKIGRLPDGGMLCAPLLRETIRYRPTLSAAALNAPVVEAELAFRMTRDIARGTTAEALYDAMIFVPLFEILGSRFVSIFEMPLLPNLADYFGSAEIALGDEVPNWTHADRAAMTVRIEGDGEVLHVLDYAARLDAAVAVVATFAERFEDRFDVLPAGTLVTTGSMTVPFAPKHRIIADYGPLGVNELIFSDL